MRRTGADGRPSGDLARSRRDRLRRAVRACHEERRWPRPIGATVVEGTLRAEADVGFTTCRRGHRIRVRRIARLQVVAAR